ncbi:MAG: AMP-binding protein, partial [Actinomycetota bacterium]
MSIAWRPPPEVIASSNVGHFMAAHGIESFDGLLARSIDDPAWFWGEVVTFLGIEFATPYERVLDTSDGIPWAKWFVGGTTSFAHNCVDRHAAVVGERTALVWEGEDGEVVSWTYAELRRQADGLAAMLAERGVGPGDAVGIFMPMLPETVAAVLAVAKLGAVFLPIFSGYAPEAISVRLEDAAAKAVITADGFYRRGSTVDMKAAADKAVASVRSVETVVVVPRLGTPIEIHGGRDVMWPAATSTPFPTEMVDSEHTLFIAYTSGTTGRPKGSVHVHGGWTVK